jgi:hypothetical protein
MANVKFDGIEEDLTAPRTPWIYYGVSSPWCIVNISSVARDRTLVLGQRT